MSISSEVIMVPTQIILYPPKEQKKVLDFFLLEFTFSARMPSPPKKALDFLFLRGKSSSNPTLAGP